MTSAWHVAAAPSSSPSLSRRGEGQHAGPSALPDLGDRRASLPGAHATNGHTLKHGDARHHHATSPLPPAFVADLKQALHQQRSFRIDQLAGLDAASNSAADPVRREVDATLRAAAQLVLIEIDAALRRIERGAFGRCRRCGEVMSSARLKALPMSTWCGSCQHQRELATSERVPVPSDQRPAL
jgi:DnaK suppressor protein